MGKWMVLSGEVRSGDVSDGEGDCVICGFAVVADERIVLLWGFLFVCSAFLKGRVSHLCRMQRC